MRARGNTSSEASLVQCLCNSLGLVLVCAATIASRLFPSRMPPLALVISSSFDVGMFWQTDPPQKHYCILKSQYMGVQQEDQYKIFPNPRKICKIPVFWYPLGETRQNIFQATSLLLKVPVAITRWVWWIECRIQISDKEPDKIKVSRSSVSERVHVSLELSYTGLLSWEMLW